MTLPAKAPADEPPDHSDGEARLIVENMPGFAWSAGEDGKLRYLNARFLEYTGKRIEEVARTEVLHPADVERTVAAWSYAVATGDPYVVEHRVRRVDGTYRWFRSSAVRIHDPRSREIGWYGVDIDIDDQKRSDEALQKSEQELRGVVDALPQPIVVLRPDGTGLYVNRPLIDYTGLTMEELMTPDTRGNPVLYPPEDWPRLREQRQRGLESSLPFEIETRIRRKDGQFRWFLVRYAPLRDEQGRILRWYASGTDIDDRKRAEDALRRSEQELRLLIETLPAMVLRTTPDGDVDYINQRYADYLGRSVAELTRQQCRDLVHPDDLDTAAREWARSLETGVLTAQYRIRRADGVYRWFQIHAEPLRDVDGHVVHRYGVHVDIDDSKRTEDALRATQAKLSRATQVATVAELAASIAHEINQPLAALVANAHACQRWLSAEPPNLERAQLTVERIIREGRDAAEVVSRIRALFQRTAPARSLLDVNEVIAEVSRLMSEELSSRNVTIATDLDAKLPATWVDRVQMQQVIVNLVRNSIEAMESADSHPKVLSIRSRRDGSDGVLVEIRDTGIGVEDVERIFEPFFSTKGHGMGMGLAICRSIVEAHEGRLWATRNSPRGATFSIRLPVGAIGSR